MKKSLLLFIFLSLRVFADANIKLQIDQSSFKAGEIVSAQLSLDASSAQSFPLQSMKGQVLGGTLYFQSISPLIHRENQASYGADAEIIFIKKPDTQNLNVTIGDTPAVITWNSVEVVPVEIPPKFIFMNFEIPEPSKLVLWLAIFLGFAFIFWGIWKLKINLDKKKTVRDFRKKLKEEILSCRNYNELVQFWQKKRTYTQTFPEIESPLEKLEVVLFKFQFKPVQSESEQSQAMDAYREFRKDVEGTLSGI